MGAVRPVALWVFVFLLLIPVEARERVGCFTPKEIWPMVAKWSKAYGLDPYLVYAVVWKESRLCPSALGRKGEIGLGQIMPQTALFLGIPPQHLWDPEWNLMATAKYLRYLYGRFHSWERALMAYNAGPTRVARGDTPAASAAYARHLLQVYAYIKSGSPKKGD